MCFGSDFTSRNCLKLKRQDFLNLPIICTVLNQPKVTMLLCIQQRGKADMNFDRICRNIFHIIPHKHRLSLRLDSIWNAATLFGSVLFQLPSR